MSFRWSEETTLKFVSKYIEHECLWNIKSPYYKNKQMKQSAYFDLEKAMNIPGFNEKEIKLKIKNIRSTYSQELKKIKESKNSSAGTDTVYIPSVKWFNLMHESLRNLTSMLTQSESNLAYNSSYTDDTYTEHCTHTYTEKDSTAEDTFEEPKSTPPTKKKKISQLSSMVSQLKEITEATNSTAEENEFVVFGKHIGLQLKSLPLMLGLEAQEDIQLYLNKIRREHLQKASEQNRFTRTPESPYTADSPFSNDSIYYNDTSNNYFEDQSPQETESLPILPTQHNFMVTDHQLSSNMLLSGNTINIQTKRNSKNDLIITAMQSANVENSDRSRHNTYN